MVTGGKFTKPIMALKEIPFRRRMPNASIVIAKRKRNCQTHMAREQ
jgi:hypothetical protein